MQGLFFEYRLFFRRLSIFVLAVAAGLGVVACQGLLGVDFSDARPFDDASSSAIDGGDGGDAAIAVDPACQASCAGCCVGSVCNPGTAADACGKSGVACAPCGAVATCRSSACVPSAVLFGGVRPTDGGYVYNDETWLWNGDAWTLAPTKIDAPPPAPRKESSMASLGGKVVLFGGKNENFFAFPYADTWLWGDLWFDTKLEQNSNDTDSPWGRQGASFAKVGNNKLVLFGGYTSGSEGSSYLFDTWDWNGTAWHERTPSSSPSARHGAALASLGGKAVLFGGGNATNELDDIWEWDDKEWTPRIVTGDKPSARAFHAMATLGDKIVLFGGDSTGETWEWNGNSWSRKLVPGPPARGMTSMITFDGKVVLFGGVSVSGALDDTWEWDGKAWTERKVPGPPARYGHAMATP